MVNGRHQGKARSATSAIATELFNDVQLCHEMHWTYDDLMNAPEEFVWAVRTILSEESSEMKRSSHRPPNPYDARR